MADHLAGFVLDGKSRKLDIQRLAIPGAADHFAAKAPPGLQCPPDPGKGRFAADGGRRLAPKFLVRVAQEFLVRRILLQEMPGGVVDGDRVLRVGDDLPVAPKLFFESLSLGHVPGDALAPYHPTLGEHQPPVHLQVPHLATSGNHAELDQPDTVITLLHALLVPGSDALHILGVDQREHRGAQQLGGLVPQDHPGGLAEAQELPLGGEGVNHIRSVFQNQGYAGFRLHRCSPRTQAKVFRISCWISCKSVYALLISEILSCKCFISFCFSSPLRMMIRKSSLSQGFSMY